MLGPHRSSLALMVLSSIDTLLACMSRKDISNLIIFDFLRYILWSFFISLSIKKSIFLGGNVCNGRYHWGKKFLSMHIHTKGYILRKNDSLVVVSIFFLKKKILKNFLGWKTIRRRKIILSIKYSFELCQFHYWIRNYW